MTPYFFNRFSNDRLQKWSPPSLIIARGVPKREKICSFINFKTTLWSFVLVGIASTHFRDGSEAGLGRAPLSHTRPKIFNYFPSPSQTRNGTGSSFPSPIRMPLKIPYPLRPAPPKFIFGFGFGLGLGLGLGFGFGFLIPYTFQISQKLFSE